MNELSHDDMLSLQDAAKFLGLHRSRVYALVNAGILPIYLRHRCRWLKVADLIRWRDTGKHTAGPNQGNRHNWIKRIQLGAEFRAKFAD